MSVGTYNSYVGEQDSDVITQKPTREGLLARLAELQTGCPEENHHEADMLLLAYINDDAITKAFRKLERWYA